MNGVLNGLEWPSAVRVMNGVFAPRPAMAGVWVLTRLVVMVGSPIAV